MTFHHPPAVAGARSLPFRGRPWMSFSCRTWLTAAASVLCLGLLITPAASAHHLMGLMQLSPGPLSGLLSGLGHPVLGPDHLLFLLAIGLVGLKHRFRWVIALLAIGLSASLLGLLQPGLPAVAFLVPLSLALTGLVTVDRLPVWLLLPVAALHGYALSEAVLGWEATPVACYLLGLLLSQSLLLLLAVTLVRRWAVGLGLQQRWLGAGLLIGLGLAFAWSELVA